MSLSGELALRIVALRSDDLPDAALHWARVGLLDYLGVTLAGAAEPAAQLLKAIVDTGHGTSVLMGNGQRTGALAAALINGTAAHALDFDDVSNTMGGHPSVPVLPALFALADERGARGLDFLAAYLVGFEVETKLARAVNFHHYQKGWHPTATLGVFGAAAACAKLMRLDVDQTATALALAASFASGIKANFGTMAKPLHVGHCARNGLLAARLAAQGYTAGKQAFEHAHGFFEVFNGAGHYTAAAVLDTWARPWDIVTPGLAIKRYPCCGSTHPALDATLDLVRRHDLHADNVERIDVWLHQRRLAHTNRPAPTSDLDAKFSVQYCVARAVTDRRIGLQHFEAEAYREPAVAGLTQRVAAQSYDSRQFADDNHFGAEVHIHTRDGRMLQGKVAEALGRTSLNPLPTELLREKFEDCCARAIDAERTAELLEVVDDFAQLQDTRHCTVLTLGNGT